MMLSDASQGRADRLIAIARITLTSFAVLAVVLDPTEPREHGTHVFGLLATYALYSLAMTWRAFRSPATARSRLAEHAVDLTAAALVVSISRGSSSPLFPLFIFAIFAATLRWQWRGAVWTATGILAGFVAFGAYGAWANPGAFELNEFIIRSSFVLVVGAFLGALGLHEANVRAEVEKLATPPEVPMGDVDQLLRRVLSWAADVIGAARVLIVWDEPEEPCLHLALWHADGYEHQKEKPGVLHPLVADALDDSTFLCAMAHGSAPQVLRMAAGRFERWSGEPLHPELRQRFSITSVLTTGFTVETARGRLFFLDKRGMTSDNLLIGGIVSQCVAGSLNRFYLLQRLVSAAVLEERVRLACDLHDGVANALTGAAFELEQLTRLSTSELASAHDRLGQVQRSLAEGQRSLRSVIGDVRAASELFLDTGLATRLEGLFRAVEHQWGLRVEPHIDDLSAVPAGRSSDVYLIVHEALINAARHAGASVAEVRISARGGRVRIEVADNGHGFRFKGHYDHATLLALGLGPATLKDRTALLGGTVTLDSLDVGSRLEVSLPIDVRSG
jgi:signal transduction histidine kinase